MPHSTQKVFLTGANGFVASHILSDLIKSGYQVTATVRSKAKAQEVLKVHAEWKDKVKFVFVSDLTLPGAFDEAIKHEEGSLDYIIHTASPVTFSASDLQKDIIDPAVMGTTSLLKSVQQFGGQRIKRFVLLGSSVSILNSFQDISVAGPPYTEKDWNPVTAEAAIEAKSPLLAYNASKKLGEKAAWKFMEENKTCFDLTVINPDIIIGPMLHFVPGPEKINETNLFAVYSFMNGIHKEIKAWEVPFYHFVDVRDVSRAHIRSLDNPETSNQRVILNSGLVTPQLVANIIRKHFPELKNRVPEGDPSQILPENVHPRDWNAEKSHQVFGKDWTYLELETTLVDTVKDILRIEKGSQK